MENFVIREKLLDYVTTDEPPMSLTSAGLIAKGSRRHRLRVLGGATGVALAVTAAFAFVPGTGGGGSSPPPSWPALSAQDCLDRVPIAPVAPTEAAFTVSPSPRPSSEQLTQITCLMVDKVLAMAPTVTFLPPIGDREVAFEARFLDDSADFVFSSARTADGDKIDLIILPRKPGDTVPADAVVQPDGTLVATADDTNGDARISSRSIIVDAWTAGTHITVIATRTVSKPATAGHPLLTTAQATEIALAHELAIYG
jgi:hypothetical protein